MKQNNSKKRGFTIVELVIVIAVIAILAAVLIPTFSGVIKSANRSVDQQAVANMNKALYAEEITDGVSVNPSDAMAIIEAAGYDVKDYTALESKNKIYWDKSSNKVIIYTDGEGVTYPAELKEKYGTSVPSDNIPKYWYTLSDAYETVTKVTDSDNNTIELKNGITIANFAKALASIPEGKTLEMQEDVTLTAASQESTATTSEFADLLNQGDYELDLHGFDLTINTNGNYGKNDEYKKGEVLEIGTVTREETSNKVSSVDKVSNVIIRNGTLNLNNNGLLRSYISVRATSSLTLENVVIKTEGIALFADGDAAQLNIVNSTIDSKVFGIGTNATYSDGMIFNIENSVIKSTYTGDSAAILVNVKCDLNIRNSTIIGGSQGAIIRGATANISDTTIKLTTGYGNSCDKYLNQTWAQGNGVPAAALVVGNRSTSYQYATVCNLKNVTLIDENSPYDRLIYIYGNTTPAGSEYIGATLTFDVETNLTENALTKDKNGLVNCIINGNSYDASGTKSSN